MITIVKVKNPTYRKQKRSNNGNISTLHGTTHSFVHIHVDYTSTYKVLNKIDDLSHLIFYCLQITTTRQEKQATNARREKNRQKHRLHATGLYTGRLKSV